MTLTLLLGLTLTLTLSLALPLTLTLALTLALTLTLTLTQVSSGSYAERCLDSYAHPTRAGGRAGVWGCTGRDEKQNWTDAGLTLADVYGPLCLSYDEFPAVRGLVSDPSFNVWVAADVSED